MIRFSSETAVALRNFKRFVFLLGKKICEIRFNDSIRLSSIFLRHSFVFESYVVGVFCLKL
jgi:hypothetical protein